MLDQDGLRNQPWVRWRVKDGQKGPMVWEVKHLRFTPVGEDGLPGEPLPLIVARDVLDPQGYRILSSVLNSTFSLYSSFAAHFSRLVSIPRRQLVSRFSNPKANRRMTLRFAGA
jgi:hypothetical protein